MMFNLTLHDLNCKANIDQTPQSLHPTRNRKADQTTRDTSRYTDKTKEV